MQYETYEGRSVEAFFRGKKWQDISLKQLRESCKSDESACLNFMTPAAFRYYLPTYMLICLDDYEASDVVFDTTIWSFTARAGDAENEALFSLRFDGYNNRQKRTIALFLKEMSDLHGADGARDAPKAALDSYWGRYLD